MPVTCPPPPRAPLLPSRPPCAVISDRDAHAPVRVSFQGKQPYSDGTSLVAWNLHICQLAAGYGYILQASRSQWPEHSLLLREISSERST
jgi:hypothetical protein